MGVCNCSMFCCTLLYGHTSIAIILMGKRELVALLNLSSWCLVMVEWLFLGVPWGCLLFVIVVFMRGSRNFRQGGGPGQFFCFFFSPQLILQKSNGQFQRNLSFFKVPEGVQHFPGGVQLFAGGGGGGSNSLFPIETHITRDFQGWVQTPCPPPSGSALGIS